MKELLFFLLLLCSFGVNAQLKNTITINENLENTKTDKHINIPGTRLYIIPAKGFIYSSKLGGFTYNNVSGVMGSESIKKQSFERLTKNVIRQIEKESKKVLFKKDVTVQGFRGTFMTIIGPRKMHSHLLWFGSNHFNAQIFAPHPSCCNVHVDELLQSLNSIWYDKQSLPNPLDTASFFIDDNVSIYNFLKYDTVTNHFLFTINGNIDSLDGSLPFVVISRQPTVSENNLAATALELENKMVSKYQMANAVKKNIVSSKINGTAFYQFETYGQINGVEALWHCCIITDGNQTFVFEGFSKTDLENSLTEFKKLAATFRIL